MIKNMPQRMLLILLTASILASCSNTKEGKSPASLQPLLCRSVSGLQTLTVTRKDAFSQNHPEFNFPSVTTVSNQTQVQIVAKALCALPQRHSQTSINCPNDSGISYELAFSNKRQHFPLVIIGGGCSFVRGLKKDQWVEQSPGFWHILGTAMGMTGANIATFSG